MTYNRIIWDFNGTILDDVRVGIDSADELLTRHRLPKIKTVERYHEVFGFPIIDYYRRIGFDFEKIPYSVLAHEWVEIYLRRVKDAHIRDGVIQVIDALTNMDIKQTILSMTKQDMLERQLDMLGITDKFDEICGLNDIYAKSKLELAKKWREDHPNDKVIYIGDTTHDAESAEMIGCDCYLITGGHQSEASLKQSKANIISSANDIIKIIEAGRN